MLRLTQCYANYQEIKDRQQRIYWIVGLFIFLILIMLLDLHTSRYVNFFSLCLLPVILATWRLGLESGLVFSFFSCLFGFTINLSLQPEAATPLLLTTAFIHTDVLFALTYTCWVFQKNNE
jgi:hypothetical protein